MAAHNLKKNKLKGGHHVHGILVLDGSNNSLSTILSVLENCDAYST